MRITHSRTATSATRKATLAVTLLGALGFIAVVGLNVVAAGKPTFELAASPAKQTVTAGDTAHFGITLKRANKFTSPITLSASGLPASAKMEATFVPNPIPGSGNSSSLSVKTNVGGTTPPDTYNLTVTGSGGGASKTTRVTVKVVSAAQPNFSLVITPSARIMGPNETSTHTVQIERSNGFDGPVALMASGLPNGVTAEFEPNPVADYEDESTVTLMAGNQAKPGTYPLTISGVGYHGSNQLNRTAALTLVVEERKAFSIAGDVAQLAPGVDAPLDLVLTNPHNFTLYVDALEVSIEPRPSASGCSSTENFAVDQISTSRYPVALPANSTKTLSQLGVANEDKPVVSMRNLDVNQDACKGAQVYFRYSGSATK